MQLNELQSRRLSFRWRFLGPRSTRCWAVHLKDAEMLRIRWTRLLAEKLPKTLPRAKLTIE